MSSDLPNVAQMVRFYYILPVQITPNPSGLSLPRACDIK